MSKIKLTKAQKRAAVALSMLCNKSKQAGFSRWSIGRVAKHDCSSFPVATMRALQRYGFAEPVCDTAVELVESGACRCGCDLWKATPSGHAFAVAMRVVVGNSDNGEKLMWFLSHEDPQDKWKRGGEPPQFDPGSGSQT